MKRILLAVFAATLFASCSNPDRNRVRIEDGGNNVSIQPNANVAGGFDVNKLANIVKQSTNPAKLEDAINTPANGITNLDLDNDGNIDYLKVTEAEDNRLRVLDDVDSTQSVTVATIKVTPNPDNSTANLNINSNPDYAGSYYQYHSSFGLTDFLLLSYLMRPHPYYVPMYHYGYYPRTYVRTRIVTTRSNGYASSRNPIYRATPAYRSSIGSASRSQRSFSPRSGSSSYRSSGFGSSRSSSPSYSSPSRSYSSGSSRSFGSSSRSSFGSSRSSSFGSSSRSRSFGGSRSSFGRRR